MGDYSIKPKLCFSLLNTGLTLKSATVYSDRDFV